MNKLDLDQLSQEIRHMTSRSALYKVLKTELSKQGHWKNKPRGKPTKSNLK